MYFRHPDLRILNDIIFTNSKLQQFMEKYIEKRYYCTIIQSRA